MSNIELQSDNDIEIERLKTPHTAIPVTHLLSNGKYSLIIDNAGSGVSQCPNGITLTRWREDEISNEYGQYVFVRDLDTNDLWSTTYQPTRAEADSYEVIFTAQRAQFLRRDHDIGLCTEIFIAPEACVEVRRITVTNLSGRRRRLELTSYGEVVLGSASGDAVHPAFTNIFVETEYVSELRALILTRRPRSAKEQRLHLFHAISTDPAVQKTQFDSSRSAFLGRGRSVHNPMVFDTGNQLAGVVGAVLDPIFSLRANVDIAPHASQVVTFVTGFANTREETIRLVGLSNQKLPVVSLGVTKGPSGLMLGAEHCGTADAAAYQRLANALIFNIEEARDALAISRNRLHQSGFWRFGVSGDLPIVLLRLTKAEQTTLVKETLTAQSYLRQRGLVFDLIILIESQGEDTQDFQNQLKATIEVDGGDQFIDKPGGVFLRMTSQTAAQTASQLSAEEIILLQAFARLVLNGERGDLSSQLPLTKVSESGATRSPRPAKSTPKIPWQHPNLEFYNGIGGFTENGQAYLMNVNQEMLPPLPWSNVVANPKFGFIVTETGGGYTWSENSRENRLTPWSNDPVSDRRGEVLYIRDVKSGEYWTPTPLPTPGDQSYQVKHGFGYSSFETSAQGINTNLILSGTSSDPLKLFRLRLHNKSRIEARSLELFLYCDWVLGTLRENSFRHLLTDFDSESQTLFAVNHCNNEFAGRFAFIGSDAALESYTTSRAEFIGRNRDCSAPLALESDGAKGNKLSQKTGAGFSSCGVLKVSVKLNPGEKKEILFFLGEAATTDEMRDLSNRCRSPQSVGELLRAGVEQWSNFTSAIQVETPDRAFDIAMNGWLMYQTVGCRLWGRSGFYQSGGAIGYRDQLQDSLALMHTRPDLTREQIILHASRQFDSGDVQHWWHPPTGRGVRTTISDDYLWLPFVVHEYVSITGDTSVLDAEAGYLEGPPLEAGHSDMYFVPKISEKLGSIYEHCILALDRALSFGAHGLPFMGGGDWNDGMNEVGKDGKGESVWLGWFINTVLNKFAPLVETRGDNTRADRYRSEAKKLHDSIEREAWDGEWYRRAYFDDGTPLGSAKSAECKIDSLAQTWAVISGAGNKLRSEQGMNKVYEHLVCENPGIISLLTPAFNKSSPNPGYIMGYLPGIRENGAQYTHAATWVVLATALLGRGTQALRLFGLLNPINHTRNEAEVRVYQGEPYVLCGDVYTAEQHFGRAGWSWYTGSSGWLYRIGLENILGLKVSGKNFTIDPCIPTDWKGFKVLYVRDGVRYRIEVRNVSGVERGVRKISIDGKQSLDLMIPLSTTACGEHQVVVEMGFASSVSTRN